MSEEDYRELLTRLLNVIEPALDRIAVLERTVARLEAHGSGLTIDEVLAKVAHEIDRVIERRLHTMEQQLRRDIALTGPEDEAALDRPPDPTSPWRRITVEEAIEMQRARFLASRAETLGRLRAELAPWFSEGTGPA
jgi:hypothetical protein